MFIPLAAIFSRALNTSCLMSASKVSTMDLSLNSLCLKMGRAKESNSLFLFPTFRGARFLCYDLSVS
jgi:hypothetical protein